MLRAFVLSTFLAASTAVVAEMALRWGDMVIWTPALLGLAYGAVWPFYETVRDRRLRRAFVRGLAEGFEGR